MNPDASRQWAEAHAIGLLLIALLFGGGSRGVGDAVVHAAAAVSLPVALARFGMVEWRDINRFAAVIVAALVGVLLLQCLPLPFNVWSAIQGHADSAAALHAADVTKAARPLTADLWGTVRALLWCMTGATAWLLLAGLPTASRLRWLQCAVSASVLMALVSYVQAMGGDRTDLQIYAIQSTGSGAGTFANRNHFASLMGMMATLAIGLAFVARNAAQRGAALWPIAAVLLLLGAAVSFSRAGFILAACAFVISIALAWQGRRAAHGGLAQWRALLAVSGLVSLAAIGIYAWQRLADRFDHDPLADTRFEYFENGVQVLKVVLPWGAGAGSFREAYGRMEPASDLTSVYALHAHNDFLEVAIEFGWPGLVLMLAGIVSVLAVVRCAWRARHDLRLPRIWMALAVLVPVLHSAADYPLRTLAVWVVACGLFASIPPRKFPTEDMNGKS